MTGTKMKKQTTKTRNIVVHSLTKTDNFTPPPHVMRSPLPLAAAGRGWMHFETFDDEKHNFLCMFMFKKQQLLTKMIYNSRGTCQLGEVQQNTCNLGTFSHRLKDLKTFTRVLNDKRHFLDDDRISHEGACPLHIHTPCTKSPTAFY